MIYRQDMPEEPAFNTIHSWEVPDIDLNIRHYTGSPSDTIRAIENSIVQYVNSPDCTLKQKQIYSAIYNALAYYKSLYHLPSIEYQDTSTTPSAIALKKINDDTKALRARYNKKDPEVPIVVTTSARIKSLDSAMNKFKSKVDEYLEDNRDFRYFNESIRDLLGIKFIIDPPAEVKALGKETETDFLYKFCYDYLKLQGIEKKPSRGLGSQITVLPVNTRSGKDKLKELKEPKKYLPGVVDGPNPIYIPKTRPVYIEDPKVDSVVKDRVKYPKENGYQKIHICTFIELPNDNPNLPNNIIAPESKPGFAIECQLGLKEHEDRALYDPNLSHSQGYKKGETEAYHRLAIPFYIESNPAQTKPLSQLNIADSFQKFYGHSFEAHFGIPFSEFSENFSVQDRNNILAGLCTVSFDPTTRQYSLNPGTKYVAVCAEELKDLIQTIPGDPSVKNDILTELSKKLFQSMGAMISPTGDPTVKQKIAAVTVHRTSAQPEQEINADKSVPNQGETDSKSHDSHEDGQEL